MECGPRRSTCRRVKRTVLAVHCNSHGCNKWNSGYNLFLLDSSAGWDTANYLPQTSILTLNMRGTNYGFSPQAFTAGTVNATTINATTVNATTVNGALNASQLPVFGASGSGHSQGAVPDPGAVPGASRYLREDGTWTAPPTGGGGSGMSSAALPVGGASADYHFLDGTGSTLTDASGNGNTATLSAGGLTPSWVPSGLAFTGQESVSLPAALNNSKTFCNFVYITPLTSTVPKQSISGAGFEQHGSGSGLNLMYDYEANWAVLPSYAP